jgi:hypothetical protein
MDPRLSYQASTVRMAELHRQAATHRLAQQALAGKQRRSSLWRVLSRAYRHRKPVGAPAPAPIKAAHAPVKPH